MSNQSGILYVVATPIGNLGDFSVRGQQVLRQAGVIEAEDTRQTSKLLRHFGIATPMQPFHEHNERERADEVLKTLEEGVDVALVSDAGTPLVSDPGYRLVRAAHERGIRVVPVPGACAAITALSASGLPSDRFAFEGFPPTRSAARRDWLGRLVREARTLIFYESPHRIVESLADMATVLGSSREAVYARELTKQFETIRRATLGELAQWVATDDKQQLGEIVVLVHGLASDHDAAASTEAQRILQLLLAELPLSRAAALAADITGRKKNELYEQALRLKPDAAD